MLFSKRFSIDVNEGGKIKKHHKSEFIFSEVVQKFQARTISLKNTQMNTLITIFLINNKELLKAVFRSWGGEVEYMYVFTLYSTLFNLFSFLLDSGEGEGGAFWGQLSNNKNK